MRIELDVDEEWASSFVLAHLKDSLRLLKKPWPGKEDKKQKAKDIAALESAIDFYSVPER